MTQYLGRTNKLEQTRSAIGTGGTTLSVFCKSTYLAPLSDPCSLRVQKLSPQGAKMWPEDGVEILANANTSYSPPEILTDGSGGAIVAYVNHDNTELQRVSSTGAPLRRAT